MDGVGHRPVRISAHTVDHVDILQIPAKAFQDNIDDEVIQIFIESVITS